MSDVRKKKPQAPSMSLSEAIEKVRVIYSRDGRHTIPTESAADALGYKNARSGSAITTLASIKMFGLLHVPQSGHLAVDLSFEEYEFSPNESRKLNILLEWVKTPKIYSELFQRFEGSMPSDATLKYELVKLGFTGKGLQKFIKTFKDSVQFSKYYEQEVLNENEEHDISSIAAAPNENISSVQSTLGKTPEVVTGVDRIPIRLSGGRKAWLEIPTPFYEGDKSVIKNQIDLIITDEEKIDE